MHWIHRAYGRFTFFRKMGVLETKKIIKTGWRVFFGAGNLKLLFVSPGTIYLKQFKVNLFRWRHFEIISYLLFMRVLGSACAIFSFSVKHRSHLLDPDWHGAAVDSRAHFMLNSFLWSFRWYIYIWVDFNFWWYNISKYEINENENFVLFSVKFTSIYYW